MRVEAAGFRCGRAAWESRIPEPVLFLNVKHPRGRQVVLPISKSSSVILVTNSEHSTAVSTDEKPSGHASGDTISSLLCNETTGWNGSAGNGRSLNQVGRRTKTEETSKGRTKCKCRR